jgi:GNAT superfamily N-acetyltransferase
MTIACRQAALGDAAAILDLLLVLAPEMPLQVDSLQREEALYALIRNCARSGESWVALDAGQRIVGFVLAEPAQLGRHYAEGELIELRHAGVAPEHRGQRVFSELIAQVLARMQPVVTSVNPLNRSAMAVRLVKRGFRPIGAAGGETRFRWDPGAAA